MYGVIIETGPKNWQILQQENGFANIELSGRVEVEEEVINFPDAVVIIRAVDENTNSRITEPVFCKLTGNKWKGTLKLQAGGLYRIESYLRYDKLCEKRGDRIFHLGVGDIYVIAGQSNAVGEGKDVVNDPIDPQVHMFRLDGSWDIATHPLHDSTGTKFPVSLEKSHTDHSPWLNFAKILNKHLSYPIGLIPATKGGIPLSFWDRAEDGAFFDNMLEIVKQSGSKVKGILWYQGCNDTHNDELRNTYFERFKRVCQDFENSFYKEIPIITVQLNKVTFTSGQDIVMLGKNYAELREIQREAMHKIKNVFMVPSIDLSVCDGIHNAAMSNMVIGERVANIALKYVYGKNIICDAPEIEKALVEDKTNLRMYFKNVQDAIFSDINRIESLMFSVTDETGRIEPVAYECEGNNTVLLKFDREIIDNATVSCDKYTESGLMPYDLYSYLPIIPFNNFKIGE